MDLPKTAESVGISLQRLEGMLERNVKLSRWPDPRLFRFEKAVSGVEAGTVIFENGEIVYGYPKIKRAMVLEPALKRFFPDRVAVEEKMNGYNARVVRIGEDVVALTRGGFICPYSTEVVRERISPQVFRDHPDIVLCGEMVGPHSPYVPKDVYPVDSLEFYLFDVARKAKKDVQDLESTHRLAEEYGIECVPLFGVFDAGMAPEEIRKIVERLGREGREGVVLKDPRNVVRPIKYTSSESNCTDLRFAFRYYNDYGRDFIFSRVVREGFQAVEWNDSEKEFRERCLRLGESILASMGETIRERMAQDTIVQRVQIKVKRLQTAWDLERHLRYMGIRVVFGQPEPLDDGYLVRIEKLAMSTNDKTKSMIEGDLW